MSVRLMVLGVMHREQKTHGYTVYHALVSWQADTWTKIRPGSIYHALSQLEKEGLITNAGQVAGSKGAAKTLYVISQTGEDELKKLIRTALVSYDQEQFTAGLAFMSVLARQEVINLAKQRLQMHHETVKFMKALPRNDTPDTPAQHEAIITSWTAIFNITHIWQKQFLQDLQTGKYVFADEPELEQGRNTRTKEK
jgi:DNA-binding PadR family transcriptional regulator